MQHMQWNHRSCQSYRLQQHEALDWWLCTFSRRSASFLACSAASADCFRSASVESRRGTTGHNGYRCENGVVSVSSWGYPQSSSISRWDFPHKNWSFWRYPHDELETPFGGSPWPLWHQSGEHAIEQTNYIQLYVFVHLAVAWSKKDSVLKWFRNISEQTMAKDRVSHRLNEHLQDMTSVYT